MNFVISPHEPVKQQQPSTCGKDKELLMSAGQRE